MHQFTLEGLLMDKLRWGILGPGHIADEFADGVIASQTGTLWAVASRERSRAEVFAAKFGIPKVHADYDALIADPQVQAIYIATPHPMHAEWAIKAAYAGKHLLVEKPIGLNFPEAMAMIDAARVNDTFLMEAFMYRCHPQTTKLWQMIRDGAVGEVRLIQAAFCYNGGDDVSKRHLANHLGGGGILDVGCYPVSMARLIAGAAQGKPFAEPRNVDGRAKLGSTGVDEWAVATLDFGQGLLAQVATGIRLDADNVVRVFGSEGDILVRDPWIPSRFDRKPRIIEWHHHGKREQIAVECEHDLYALEADEVGQNIKSRQAPAMTWDDTLGNMRTLDQWRRAVGLVYESEKPKNVTRTLTGRPLARRSDQTMNYGRIAGIDKPISRLVFGCDHNNTMPDTAIMLDDFFEHGGNTFDTSHGYGWPNGSCERNLGQWIRNRGVRDQVVVIEKGANAPNDHGKGLTKELIAGLERLQMDQVDIYMIHRDNEQVPIGEWVDALNENLKAGRMKVFGLSNFTLERLRAFKDYADQRGLASFSMVSNQMSLARVRGRIWEDCYLISSSDSASRAFFTQHQIALMPWSSQARGFFTDAARPDYAGNEEWSRCWYSPENFDRQRRARELAQKKGVEMINIALAWVLHQPFPTFPLVGPKTLWETRSTMKALSIELSAHELQWLDLG
jgi:predicted dehydrogenase/aryl-alcohol dehydrogenase-like predicted oxidoreductase